MNQTTVMNNQNQVVIITGAAQGIGYGIAECFARKGASIVVADAKAEAVDSAAQKLKEAGAPEAIGASCDITSRLQIDEMVSRTLERFGRIDVLVNNAGVCPFIPVMEMDAATWQRTLDINLTGAFNCTQAVAAKMIEAGHGGKIIFITSLAETLTQPTQVDYGASKAGLKMAMAGFATALGEHGITCNAIAPGMILTPLTESHWSRPGPAEQIKQLVPMKRIGTPHDIGNAAVCLASPEAAYIPGITLRVDGGFQVLIKG